MGNPSILRQQELYSIAEKDMIYQTWAKSYEACREDFTRFANRQPEDVRNFLYGYAECGRLMYQRMVNLACEHMIFLEKE